ncbi:MAG TPA: TolC family protein [Gemmatimonadales bacterium]
MARTEYLMSAAFAALIVATPIAAQQPVNSQPVTSITLTDAVNRARLVSPTVVTAQGNIRSAALAERGGVVSFLPALTVSPQMSLQLANNPGQTSRIDPITGDIISGNSTLPAYSFGASASYTFFDGFQRNYTLRRERAQQTSAAAQLTVSQYSSDFNTTDAFFVALADKQLVAVAQSSVDAAQGQLQLATAKLQAGSGQLSDSLTALGNFLQARLGLLTAQSNLIVGETNLGRLVGVSGQVAAIDDSAFYHPTMLLDTASVRREIMQSSPALQSLQANVDAAEAAWKSSKGAYYPTLSATGAQSWTGYYAHGTQPSSNTGLTARRSLSITLSINPWTNLTRETQIENASIAITNAQVTLTDQRNQLAAQINQAYASLSTAQETLNVTDVAVDAGRENLRVVTERYRAGVATITEVLTAQNQLISAQSSQVQARYSYIRAKAQIEQILGRKI